MARISNKNCFTRGNVGRNSTQLYTWCYENNIDASSTRNLKNGNTPVISCNATKGSQGIDNVTKYVYELGVVNGVPQHLAYVACDYVQ